MIKAYLRELEGKQNKSDVRRNYGRPSRAWVGKHFSGQINKQVNPKSSERKFQSPPARNKWETKYVQRNFESSQTPHNVSSASVQRSSNTSGQNRS